MPTPLILAAAALAGWYDVTQRRVPNPLVAVLAVVALVWHGVSGGWSGLGASAAGLGVGLLLFPFFVLRGLGAGDVKFVAALGAAVTWRLLPAILLLAAVIAAAFGLFTAVRRGLLVRTLRNVAALRPGGAGAPSIDSPGAVLLPFSAAAAAATWAVLLLGRP